MQNRRQGTHALAETAVVYASRETSQLLDRPPRKSYLQRNRGHRRARAERSA